MAFIITAPESIIDKWDYFVNIYHEKSIRHIIVHGNEKCITTWIYTNS